MALLPFPLAYHFLTKEYQRKLGYEDYLNHLLGLGISLIKLCRVPDLKRGIKFFYEIETIEAFAGTSAEYFGYSRNVWGVRVPFAGDTPYRSKI
ncbi:hypothetical protein [Neobacillus fumarioli]|uniref:hypothetical protein n=1 Tax=Neobacillus fumarioli TaxID=105229 RepID=UPI0008316A07|nr:hypothetical protein [Neobacillus fumarioli]